MREAFRALSREVFRTRGEIYCDAKVATGCEREKDSIEPPRWMLLLLLFQCCSTVANARPIYLQSTPFYSGYSIFAFFFFFFFFVVVVYVGVNTQHVLVDCVGEDFRSR